MEAPSGVHFTADRRRARFKCPDRPREEAPNVCRHYTVCPTRVAFVRHVGPYDRVAVAWDRLCTFLGKEGLLGGDAQFIGVCHDDPAVTEPARIRYDACVTVDRLFVPQGDIGVQVISGGDYAVLTHVGPYSGLGASYAKLFGQWLPRSGRRLRAEPCFEAYLNSPENTAPEDLIVDLHAPLETR